MNEVLEFKDVSFRYPSGHEALTGINFSVASTDRIALLGLNGAGKSTLLLLTNGLLIPTEGSVCVSGKNTAERVALIDIRRSIGMVFQNADDQLFMPTVKDDVAFGPRNMGLSNEEVESRVRDALTRTGCEALADMAPFELSGGQRKMVSIATVLSMRPKLLVLDEPTTGLDYSAVARFEDILMRLHHPFIMSTHNLETARALCNRAIVLEKGRIVFDGPMTELDYPPEQ